MTQDGQGGGTRRLQIRMALRGREEPGMPAKDRPERGELPVNLP